MKWLNSFYRAARLNFGLSSQDVDIYLRLRARASLDQEGRKLLLSFTVPGSPPTRYLCRRGPVQAAAWVVAYNARVYARLQHPSSR